MKPAAVLIQGDARHLPLRDASVQCVVCSPPYWGLRDYQLPPLVWDDPGGCEHEWGDDVLKDNRAAHHLNAGLRERDPGGRGGVQPQQQQPEVIRQGTFCLCCSAWCGSFGLEPTPDLYVQHLVEIFREVRRVLRDDGTVWLNLGDCYHSGNRGGYHRDWERGYLGGDLQLANRGSLNVGLQPNRLPQAGLKDKDLVGLPWLVAFALRADGWWLRSDIIWSKPNPMPESVTDRPTKSHEYLFLLSKNATYYYDAEAIKEPMKMVSLQRLSQPNVFIQPGGPKDPMTGNRSERKAINNQAERLIKHEKWKTRFEGWDEYDKSLGRNRRTVWEIATSPFPEAHFATFPPDLVAPCILAGTSERGACPGCGAPWEREKERTDESRQNFKGSRFDVGKTGSRDGGDRTQQGERFTEKTVGWRPTCACGREDTVPCIVLDPFAGSGTVPMVAQNLGRVGIGLELKSDYLAMAAKRTAQGALL